MSKDTIKRPFAQGLSSAARGDAGRKGRGELYFSCIFGAATLKALIGTEKGLGGEAFSQVWGFIVAPLVGGALAAVVYKFLAKE